MDRRSIAAGLTAVVRRGDSQIVCQSWGKVENSLKMEGKEGEAKKLEAKTDVKCCAVRTYGS